MRIGLPFGACANAGEPGSSAAPARPPSVPSVRRLEKPAPLSSCDMSRSPVDDAETPIAWGSASIQGDAMEAFCLSDRSGSCEESGDDLVYPLGMGDRA